MQHTPVFIICYNNGWLVKDTIDSLQRFAQTFVVINNASHEPTTVDYLHSLRGRRGVSVWDMPQNWGPRCFFRPLIWASMPEYFALTDPDLEYPNLLPDDFIEQLRTLTDTAKVFKAGLALDRQGPPEIFQTYSHVQQEARFWKPECRVQTGPDRPPIYNAAIDTTFAVYRKSGWGGSMFVPALRVAGAFTVKHRPWYKSFWQEHAERLPAMYDGAVYSTTASINATDIGISPFAVRVWRPADPAPQVDPANSLLNLPF